MSELVGVGVFSLWTDAGLFARVSIDQVAGTVSWPGGIDLCPDRLYHDITGTPLPGSAQAASEP